MGLLERKRERIDRIDQELYLILAGALMWLFELQSQQGWVATPHWGQKSWGRCSEGKGLRWRSECPFPAGRSPRALWLTAHLCVMQGWREGRTGEEVGGRTGEEVGGSTDSPTTYCVLSSVPRAGGRGPSTLPAALMGHPRIHQLRHILSTALWLALRMGRQKPPSFRGGTLAGNAESK